MWHHLCAVARGTDDREGLDNPPQFSEGGLQLYPAVLQLLEHCVIHTKSV